MKYQVTFKRKSESPLIIELDREPWVNWNGDLVLRHGYRQSNIYARGHWRTVVPYVEPPPPDDEAARYVREQLKKEAIEKEQERLIREAAENLEHSSIGGKHGV